MDDQLLQMIAEAVNVDLPSLPVRLSVHGLLIEGTLIARFVYIELLKGVVETSPQLNHIVDQLKDKEDVDQVRILHLRDARVICPNETTLGLWRVPIDEVDGFSLVV